VVVEQAVQERDGLDGLPQAHLIGQDAAVASMGETEEETE